MSNRFKTITWNPNIIVIIKYIIIVSEPVEYVKIHRQQPMELIIKIIIPTIIIFIIL